MMSERQQQAAAIAAELQKLGAFVINAMPLDDTRPLRFQILQTDIERILPIIRGWDWNVHLHSSLSRVTATGMKPAMIYEIDLPRIRNAVVDTRTIRGDVAERKKTQDEVNAVMKHL